MNELMMEHWYCIYTKPKMEELVSRRLLDVPGLEVFSPKLKRRKYMKGNWKDVVEVLFPSYIFSRFNPVNYYHMIKYTRGVRNVVGDASGNPTIVDDQIIKEIRSRISNGFVHLELRDFSAGDQVMIHEGPFAGLGGIFIKDLHARDRVLILLNTILYQASLEIECGFLSRD